MTKFTPPDSREEPVIRISYQSSLGESRGAVFETYMPQSATVLEITDIMNKLREVCDRQTAVAKIEELKRAIASDKAHLEAGKADMQRIEEHQMNAWITSGRKGEFKLSQAEAQARLNVEGNLVNRKKSIELLEAQLAEYEAKLVSDVG
jgi:signal transduction histidine kinase